jgi:hypothetical protein
MQTSVMVSFLKFMIAKRSKILIFGVHSTIERTVQTVARKIYSNKSGQNYTYSFS